MKKVLTVMMVCLIALAAFANGTSETSKASSYPNQTITLICPYGAGGGTDLILRALCDSASKISGVNIIVNDVTGGNGATGVVTMMKSNPDGYTIGSCSGEWISLVETGLAPAGFDYNNAEKIMHYNFDPSCYLVRSDSPYKTIEDVIATAKAKPGDVTLGVTAAGGAQHLTAILFQNMVNAKFNIIPYSEGASTTMAALLSGQVDVASVGPAECAAQVDAGKVRLIGVCSENRLATRPDVPTLKEKGINLIYGSWRALAAPKGTPAEIVKYLEDLFLKAANTDEFKAFCTKNGFVIDVLDKAGFEKRFAEQKNVIHEVCQLYAAMQK